jgi:hypothetical protein
MFFIGKLSTDHSVGMRRIGGSAASAASENLALVVVIASS